MEIQDVPEMSSSDTTLHILDGTCWCQPVIDYEDPISGNRVYVHRRYIDGLGYEEPRADGLRPTALAGSSQVPA